MGVTEEGIKKWLLEHPTATTKIAYEAGYREGHDEGYKKGYTKGSIENQKPKPKYEWISTANEDELPQVAMNVWVCLKNGLVFRDMSLDASDYGYFQNHALEEVEGWTPYFEPEPMKKAEQK